MAAQDLAALAALGVATPSLPGSVSLCWELAEEAAATVAGQYKGWLFLGAAEDARLPRGALEAAGCPLRLACAGLASGAVADDEVEATLSVMDQLEQPFMIQGPSGYPDAFLLLWLAKKRGQSKEAARQLGTDLKLTFVTSTEDAESAALLAWVLSRLPAHDSLPVTVSASGLVFRQLHSEPTCTQTYILGCNETKEAVVIDPVLEDKDRDLAVIADLGLKLKYVVNTHCHADHVTAGGAIRRELPEVKTVIAGASGAKADVHVKDGDAIHFGRFSLVAIATPGHTDGCVTWQLKGDRNMLFTGDTLLIRGCGRTDFQAGDSGELYENVHRKIFSQPGETPLYPGHDYKGRNMTSVEEERLFNPRLTKPKPDFVDIMANLNLPYPKRIDTALPMNLICGIQDNDSLEDVCRQDLGRLSTMGVTTPQLPGDVSFCSFLSGDHAPVIGTFYRSWLFLGDASSADVPRAALETAKCPLEVLPLASPGGPLSEEEAEAALAAIGSLERPLMVQGPPAFNSAVFLLWLARARGYTKEAARQLGADLRLPCAITEDGPSAAALAWVLERLPAHDELPASVSASGLVFRQLHSEPTCTKTYILGCSETKEAILLDPVLEDKDRDLAAIAELGLTLKYVVNTHCHADHVTSGGAIRKALPDVKTVIAKASGAQADVHVGDGDTVTFGRFSLVAIATPGHTDGCITWQLQGDRPMLFTGDTLLIRGCGRTDFQAGSSGDLYENVHGRIFSQPGSTMLFPGHDYKGRNLTTVEEEKLFNPRLTKRKEEFIDIMANLNLPYPKKIDTALSANLVCGVQD